MAVMKTFKLSHPLLGVVALIFLVGYKNHVGYLRGESHLIFSGDSASSKSELITFEQSPNDGGALEITEDVMADLALDEARTHLKQYLNSLPELRNHLLSLASLSAADPKDLFQAWVRQDFPQLHQLSLQTKSDDLRSHIQSLIKYPQIKRSAL